jgi:hypothetical protein
MMLVNNMTGAAMNKGDVVTTVNGMTWIISDIRDDKKIFLVPEDDPETSWRGVLALPRAINAKWI